jgi:hypothetical protein
MAWPEGEYGVHGGDPPSARGEVEVVRVAVLGEAFIGRFGKLMFEDKEMGIEPWDVVA